MGRVFPAKLKLTTGDRSFKHLRKFAANEIAKKFQDKQYLTDQFLSHSVEAMKKITSPSTSTNFTWLVTIAKRYTSSTEE